MLLLLYSTRSKYDGVAVAFHSCSLLRLPIGWHDRHVDFCFVCVLDADGAPEPREPSRVCCLGQSSPRL